MKKMRQRCHLRFACDWPDVFASNGSRSALAFSIHVPQPVLTGLGVFLDQQMLYSCGFFRAEEDSREQAQRNKMDLICHKLQISRGDRVLKIGCGWGSFALHAARNYGARITGQTLSPAQYEFATQLLSLANLPPGSAQILLHDYRQLNGPHDAI